MQVKISYYQNGFGAFVKKFIIMCFIFCFVTISVAVSEDDYLFLFNSLKNSFGTSLGTFVIEDTKVTTNKLSSESPTTLETLDFSLIDKIVENTPKKGYIKELLTLYKDASEGQLRRSSESTLKVHVPFTALLGIHAHETANYTNTFIPGYYFKLKNYKKGSAHYSVLGYTTNSYNNVHAERPLDGSAYGIAQYSSWKLDTKAKIDPIDNNRRGTSSGDARFLPDVCADIDKRSSVLNKYVNVSKLSDSALSSFFGIMNNRGESGTFQLMFGIGYLNGDNYLNKKRATAKEITAGPEALSNLFIQYAKDYNPKIKIGKYLTSSTSRIATPLIACHYDGWFISPQLKSRILEYNQLESMWANLFPKEKNYSITKIKELLNKHTAVSINESINEVTGDNITLEDCRNVYGVSNYQNCHYYSSGMADANRGYIWHVSKERDAAKVYSNAYLDGSRPYILTAYDAISAGYAYSTSILGAGSLYFLLLKEAGVNIGDSTNPISYVSNNVGTSTWVTDVKRAFGSSVTLDNLSYNRQQVIAIAAQMCNSGLYRYSTDYRTGSEYSPKKKNYKVNGKYYYGLDCSSFCCTVYKKAGFKTPLTNTDGLLAGNNGHFKVISITKIQPGDLAVVKRGNGSRYGHAVIFLGWANKQKTSMHCVEINRSGEPIHFTKNKSIHDYRGTYKGMRCVKENKTGTIDA